MIDELELKNELSQMFQIGIGTFDYSPIGLSNPPTILWEGRHKDSNPPVDKPYIRFTISPDESFQSSLAGSGSTRLYKGTGLINVQAFGPVSKGNGYEVAEYVAIMAKRVFQGKKSPNDIWFKNCRIKRIGPSGGWYQFNTIIEYNFNEQR